MRQYLTLLIASIVLVSSKLAINSAFNPFNSDSKCSTAINLKKYGYLRERLPQVPRISLPKHMSCTKLKIINPGPGTTGTRSVQASLCDVLWIRSWHYKDNCYQTHTSAFRAVSTFQQQDTYHDSPRGAKEKIARVLDGICREAVAIGDTPSSELFVDLSLLAPQAIAVFTFRDPALWATRRVASHAHEVLLCDFRLWQHSAVLHPFDLLGCLAACQGGCAKPFMSMHSFVFGEDYSKFKPPKMAITDAEVVKKIKLLQEAYVCMNTVNLMMASRKEMLPLCLWDMQNTTRKVLAEKILGFLHNSSLNVSLNDVVIHENPPSHLVAAL